MMCAVSFVSDHYGQYDDWFKQHIQPSPLPPQPIPWPTLQPALPWDREALDMLKDVLKRLDALDKRLGLAECEDPKKAEWMAEVELRVKALEERAAG